MTSGPSQQRSEVADLLTQICCEYEAAQQGLSGLAQGISQHQFITRRMECIGELHSQLHNILGNEAMALISARLDHASPDAQIVEQERRAT